MKRNFFSTALLMAVSSAVMAQSSIDTYDVGDVNLNGEVSVADATSVVNQVLANTPGSEVVTAKDLNAVLQLIDSRLAALETANGISHPSTPGANTSATYFEFALKSMQVGQTFTQAVHTESTGVVSYLSTNSSVATVNATTGEVTALSTGETMIVATIAASGEYTAASAAYTVTVESANMHNGYEYVDLGVVVGGKTILWAKTNIGATLPADYGDYYAWGETETKSVYNWETYQYAVWVEDTPAVTDEDGFVISPASGHYEGTNIGEDIQGTQYDAAHVNWGGNWRMPTLEELDALRNQCDWRWGQMLDSDGNSHDGYKVMNKSDNSKYIFLPAAGVRGDSYLYFAGSNGGFWSSSLNSETSAYDLYFKSSSINLGNNHRCFGQSVRPVCVLSE